MTYSNVREHGDSMIRLKKINIITLTLLAFSVLPTVCGQSAIDLAINPSGYTTESSVYAYSQYVYYMEDIGAYPSDFMLVHDPIEVAELAYQKGEVLVFIEVFRYASVTEAVEEYDAQKNDMDGTSKLYNGPMFQRFISRDRIFRHENYIALASFEPYNDGDAYTAVNEVFEAFIENMVQEIWFAAHDEPTANGDSAVWGVQVGDIISWTVNDDSFVGTIMSGGGSSSANWVPEIEIVEISDSGHAVFIKEQKAVTEYWYENEARATINIPYEGYSWRTISNNGISILDSNDKQTMPLIYPLELNGDSLTVLIDETISYLPEKTQTPGDDTYRVYGKTRSGSGYTPVETQWLDITAHRGTGIVTAYDWYYNNNDYGITARSQIGIGSTNIDFGLRKFQSALKEFFGDIYIEPNPGEVGDIIEVEIDLFDVSKEVIIGAMVTASLDGKDYAMTEQGNGVYIALVDTGSFDTGDYDGIIIVEKTGFETAEGGFTFTLTESSTLDNPEPNSTSVVQEIPGMPVSAIIVGVSLLVASRKREK